jgi:hypothetical protein
VLDFEVAWIDDPALASRVADLWPTYLGTRLGAMDEWLLIERPRVAEAMTAAREDDRPVDRRAVGRRVGAQFVLSGRGFRIGDKVMLALELIDVETGQMRGLAVQFPSEMPLGAMLTQACDKLIEQLPAKLHDLRSSRAAALGAVGTLRHRFGVAAWQWCVAAAEQYEGVEVESAVLKGEIERLLTAAGQKVRVLNDSASQALASGRKTLSEVLDGETVDYCVIGNGRAVAMDSPLAELALCRGNVEMRILDGRSGEVVATGALGDQGAAPTAAKAAAGVLRSAGRSLLVRLIDRAQAFETPAAESSDPHDKPQS